MGIIDSNKVITRPDYLSGTISYTFTASKSFNISNTKKYRYMILTITSDQHSNSEFWDCYAEVMNSSFVVNAMDVNGGVFPRIKRNGIYIIDTLYKDSILLYFQDGTVEKTITINYVFCSNPPLLQDARPITRIYGKTITLDENTNEYTVGTLIQLSGYKFYIIAVRMTTGSGGNAPMTFTFYERYRDTFEGLTNKETPSHELVTVQDSRYLNSDWFPVKSQSIQLILSVQEPVTGYKAYINVYGVR